MGIFAKFAAALVSIPSSVLGGMTTFLFSAVAAAGVRIMSTMPWTRRNRFILTAAFTLGFGATLVPEWVSNISVESAKEWLLIEIQFSYVFTYSGDNRALLGFFNAISLVMETGFAIAAFVSLILNLALPEEDEDMETPELTANTADEQDDREEWNRIQGAKTASETKP